MSNTIIKIVPADFEKAYNELDSVKTSLDEYKAALQECYTAMKENWTGAAADAFDAYVPSLLGDHAKLILKMSAIANDIKLVGDEMQVLDQDLAGAM